MYLLQDGVSAAEGVLKVGPAGADEREGEREMRRVRDGKGNERVGKEMRRRECLSYK